MSAERSVRRVLMTTDTVGGVWTYALELCRGLQAYGTDVLLAAMGAPLRNDQHAALEELPNVVLAESSFALEWMTDPWGDVDAAGEWLLSLEGAFEPEVIHLNGYAHGNLGWRAPVVVVGHSCVLSWWEAVRGEAAPGEWNEYRARVAAGLQAAQTVVAPSFWMLHQLGRHYGAFRNVRVVYNGVSEGDHLLTQAKEPFVLSVGRFWDEAKNAETLARAARGLPWPVRLAGNLRSPEGRETAFPNVETLGHQSGPAMASLYRRASIYALPARYEPFGLSVLEAAHQGCALVLSDLPSFREIWGDAAVYTPGDDPVALERVLRSLIENRVSRRQRGEAALRRAQRYARASMTAAYTGIYRSLAGIREPAPILTP